MRKLALIGALVLATFAVACGSDDDDTENGTPGGTATATATATSGGDGSGGGTGPGGGTGTGPGDGSGGGNPLAVLDLFGDAEYQVTYNTEGTSAEGNLSGTMTMYQKQDRQRIDLVSEQAGAPFEVTTIITPEATIFCLVSEETCLNSPGLGDGDPSAFATSILDDVREGSSDAQLNPIGQRTIAGVTAECFEVTDADGAGTTCLSPEGVPLLVDFQGTNGSTWKMEATEYSTSVSDDEFEPPFEVTSLGF